MNFKPNKDRRLTDEQFQREFGHLNWSFPEGWRLPTADEYEKPYAVAPRNRAIGVWAIREEDGRKSVGILKIKEYEPGIVEKLMEKFSFKTNNG